jgi:hypothetical protein
MGVSAGSEEEAADGGDDPTALHPLTAMTAAMTAARRTIDTEPSWSS